MFMNPGMNLIAILFAPKHGITIPEQRSRGSGLTPFMKLSPRTGVAMPDAPKIRGLF